jgi:hypothetical protein
MDRKHEKKNETSIKTLTVEDLAAVAGGAICASEYEDKIAKCRYGASGGAVLSPTPILSSL